MATDWRDEHIAALHQSLASTREALTQMIEGYAFLVRESPLAHMPVAVGAARGVFLVPAMIAAGVLSAGIPVAPGEGGAHHEPL